MVVFTANFCNLSCFLLTYSTTYHFCFCFLFAPVLFLVQNLLIWCKFVSKILIIIFFGAACIYRYFYVPVQFATFLSGCILVTFWFLLPFSAIIIWFWLPFQYTIITGLFDSLHQFQLGCNFKKGVQIFPRFSTKFYFRLLALHTIIKSFFDVLHSFIKGCILKKSGCIY